MVFDNWHVGRIVSKRGTVLFPPMQMPTRGHLPVPVYTGVTIQPGDTESSVIRRAIEQHPTYLGHYRPDELRLEVVD